VSIAVNERVVPRGHSALGNEAQLIRQAQAGDAEAFCQIAQAYERRIYSLAFHYCRARQDAEDLSQEVWLKAYAALRTFRGDSSFYTWLRSITINCFLNYRRKTLPWQRISDAGAPQSSDHPASVDLEPSLQNQLLARKIFEALAEVSSQQRLIFLLKHEEGMTYEEISAELGCSTGTVKKSISRTVKKLREKLNVQQESEAYISCAAAGVLR
jgi:RNA polymerase sigma-70 factor, ECF subfamily